MFRFVAYGLVGWVLEILFTGSTSVLRGDRAAGARTYLWMHPIYGLAALGLERVHDRIQWAPRTARAATYAAIIYAVEYGSGSLLRWATGTCPWDYGRRPRSVRGLVRLDYAPLWFLVGLAMEPTRGFLERTEKLLAAPPPSEAAVPVVAGDEGRDEPRARPARAPRWWVRGRAAGSLQQPQREEA